MDDYFYARTLFDQGYYDLAADQLERVLRDFPRISEAAEAQFLLGESYFRLERFDLARSAFLKTAIVHSESPRAPEAMFKVGVSLEKADKLREAADAYGRIHGFYPNDPQALVGMSRAVVLYAIVGDTNRADAISERLIEQYPNSEAADEARLHKAQRLLHQGDRVTARLYLKKIAQQFNRPDLASAALYELGKLMRDNWELDSAETIFRTAINSYPNTRGELQSRLELVKLLIVRGLTDQAMELLSPLLSSENDSVRTVAISLTGDAYYHRKKYRSALVYYDSIATVPKIALKAAWTTETAGDIDGALNRYLALIQRADVPDGHVIDQALLRAAILASEMGRYLQAVELWERILRRNDSPNSSLNRVWFELCRSKSSAGLSGVGAAADSLIARCPTSPWVDDAVYTAAMAAVREENYPTAIQRLDTLTARYPASPFIDSPDEPVSAVVTADFIRRYWIRGNGLIERMAQLASNPSSDPVRRNLDWGNFYLDLFCDPVRAIDQFDWVLNDSTASVEDQRYALHRTGQGYLLLYEAELRQNDDFTTEMYGDSVRNQLHRFEEQYGYSDKVISWMAELLWLELTYNSGVDDSITTVYGSRLERAILDHHPEYPGDPVHSLHDMTVIPPKAVVAYLKNEMSLDVPDSSRAMEYVTMVETMLGVCSDVRMSARLKMWEVFALTDAGFVRTAVDSAESFCVRYPQTPAGADLMLWLIQQDSVTAARKYELLEQYRQLYPYRIETERFDRLKADLLDSLGLPLEALTTRMNADSAANWGVPDLDILAVSNDTIRFNCADAYIRAGQLSQAHELFRTLLNLYPNSGFAPAALFGLAQIHYSYGESAIASAYLDTLERRFPRSPSNYYAEHLRPELLMNTKKYSMARSVLTRLAEDSDDPDSLYHYRMQQTVCLYRLNRLEEAHSAAREFYSDFRERETLDQAKALFHLEKGRSLEQSGNPADARKEYRIVTRDFRTTEWVDDAAYFNGLSLVAGGDVDEGITALERFLEDYPESEFISNAYLSLGLSHYDAEQYPESVAALKRVWENDSVSQQTGSYSQWLTAFEVLIKVYRDLRFWDASIRLVRDYIERFPNAPDLLDRRMDIGQYYLQLGQWNDAIGYYRPLLPLANAEQEAEIQYYIGEAYFNSGDFRTAILEYLKVKLLGRRTQLDWGVTALYQTGLCYEELEDWAGAARMYQQIIAERGGTSNYGRAAQRKLDALPERP